jgi:DNA repair exonuclease SbcCD nuclease subunit
VHLDSPLRGLERYEGAPVEEIRGATRRAFENLVELAIREEVHFILLAGDLYDGDWKDYNTGLFFVAQMSRLKRAGIRAFVVAGNHDAASQLTKALRPPENVHVFSTSRPESVVLEDLGAVVHGQGFASRSISDDLSAGYPLATPGLFNIGMLHTSLDGRPGHALYAPCTVDGLRSRGYRYWALGHVHKREVVAEDPWIVYPGNVQGRHAQEGGEKGCTLVTVLNDEYVEIQHRSVDVVRWSVCEVNLADADEFNAIYERVADALDEAIEAADGRLLAIRLRLTGVCPLHTQLVVQHEQLLNECRSLALTRGEDRVWIEKVVLDTRLSMTNAASRLREDALGELLRSIHDWEIDDNRLSELGQQVSDLAKRLPLELRAGADAFDPCAPDVLQTILEDVKETLLERLLTSEAPD